MRHDVPKFRGVGCITGGVEGNRIVGSEPSIIESTPPPRNLVSAEEETDPLSDESSDRQVDSPTRPGQTRDSNRIGHRCIFWPGGIPTPPILNVTHIVRHRN